MPDLLVEVLSPSNRRCDTRTERDRHERAGVRESWIVDPDAHTVEQLVLRRGRCVATTAAPASERVALRSLRGIAIDLAEVWWSHPPAARALAAHASPTFRTGFRSRPPLDGARP